MCYSETVTQDYPRKPFFGDRIYYSIYIRFMGQLGYYQAILMQFNPCCAHIFNREKHLDWAKVVSATDYVEGSATRHGLSVQGVAAMALRGRIPKGCLDEDDVSPGLLSESSWDER
jgi:hypothetical protein